MAELLELTVAEAAARIAAGEIAREEYFEAWRDAAAGDELNAYLWRAENGGGGDDGPLAGIPGRRQGPLLHRGRTDDRWLADPRGTPAALHGHCRAAS